MILLKFLDCVHGGSMNMLNIAGDKNDASDYVVFWCISRRCSRRHSRNDSLTGAEYCGCG